ncbi:MAG: hypothetical protein ABGZ17_28200 [Planctomycetaceae bacterium]
MCGAHHSGRLSTLTAVAIIGSLLAADSIVYAAGGQSAEDELYAAMSVDDVRAATLQWVAARKVNDQRVLQLVGKMWVVDEGETLSATELLSRVLETFRLADPDSKRFIDHCSLTNAPLLAPRIKPLLDRDEDAFYQANMSLFYGRYLAQRRMYDEALDILGALDAHTVVDPSSCLFFTAVCQHQLLKKKDGLATIERLLQDTEGVPVSYSTVASLMQYELKALSDKSLDDITRRMSDVERRLDLGRSGQKVQKREQEIIALLDELIERMEQSGGGGGGGGASGNQPSGPAKDSSVGGQKGPGDVDRKNVGKRGLWGALPPKAEARVKQDAARKFPPHYREAIERYSRKLSNRRAYSGK